MCAVFLLTPPHPPHPPPDRALWFSPLVSKEIHLKTRFSRLQRLRSLRLVSCFTFFFLPSKTSSSRGGGQNNRNSSVEAQCFCFLSLLLVYGGSLCRGFVRFFDADWSKLWLCSPFQCKNNNLTFIMYGLMPTVRLQCVETNELNIWITLLLPDLAWVPSNPGA